MKIKTQQNADRCQEILLSLGFNLNVRDCKGGIIIDIDTDDECIYEIIEELQSYIRWSKKDDKFFINGKWI